MRSGAGRPRRRSRNGGVILVKKSKRLFAYAVCILLVLCGAACGADASGQYAAARAEIESFCAEDTLACRYETVSEAGTLYCADGNWYCATDRPAGTEYLAYEGRFYMRSGQGAWTDVTDAAVAPAPDKRAGLYELCLKLPAQDSCDRVKTEGGRTVFTCSKAGLKAMQQQAADDAERLAGEAEADDPFLENLQFNAQLMQAAVWSDGTITIERDGGQLREVRLDFTLDVPKIGTGEGGALTLLDERETVTQSFAFTALDDDADAIRSKIADASSF